MSTPTATDTDADVRRLPCPGHGLCCNRPIFDRTLFPCDLVKIRTAERDTAIKRAEVAEAELALIKEHVLPNA